MGTPGNLALSDDALCAIVWHGLHEGSGYDSPSTARRRVCGFSFLVSRGREKSRVSAFVMYACVPQARAALNDLGSPTGGATRATGAIQCCPTFGIPKAGARHVRPGDLALYQQAASDAGRSTVFAWFSEQVDPLNLQNGTPPLFDEVLFTERLAELTDLREFDLFNLFETMDKHGTGEITFDQFYVLFLYYVAYHTANCVPYFKKYGNDLFHAVALPGCHEGPPLRRAVPMACPSHILPLLVPSGCWDAPVQVCLFILLCIFFLSFFFFYLRDYCFVLLNWINRLMAV